MTSLLSSSTSAQERSHSDVSRDLATRRPLVLQAGLGGLVAAGSTLLVCLAVGVVGWFLTDAGAHGTPTGGLRVGALGWLMAHGSQVSVEGVRITALPLGGTMICLWAAWRVGHRVGVSVSGHGPDADRISDGERDWTVPVACALFTLGYVVVAVVTASLAATPATDPSTARVVLSSLLVCAAAAAPAIAIGSGRAAIWATALPPTVRAASHTCRRILVTWLVVSTVTVLAALVLDFDTAANVVSQLRADAGDVALLAALSLLVFPNAVVFAGSYLLGPGFSVGTGTLVTPNAVVLGPLPMFPLLAALPDGGSTPAWTPWLIASPVAVGALGAALAQRARPTARWDEAAVRGGVGGVLAGLAFGVLAALAGGAVGPGRMSEVGPMALEVLMHAVTAFGIGGLLGALGMTWWRRRLRRGSRRAVRAAA